MGKEIVYCEICGDRILEQEFEKGRAITLLNKNYCAKCKDEAVKSISAEDIPEEELDQARRERSSALMKAVRADLPTKTPPRGTPAKLNTPPRAPAAHRNTPRPSAASGSKTPILVGAAIGGVAILVLILLIASGGGKDSNGGEKNGGKGGGGSNPKAEAAEKAWSDIQTMIRAAESSNDYEQVLVTISRVQSQIDGSKYADQVADLKIEYERKKKEYEIKREITSLLDEANTLAKNDPNFKQYATVIAKYDSAMQKAKLSPKFNADVETARTTYVQAYNRKGDDAYFEMKEEIRGWMDQGMYKNAMAVIDQRFEAHLRQTSIWKTTLEKIYKDCEEKAKTEKKSTGGGGGGGGGDDSEWVSFADIQRWSRAPQEGEKQDSWQLSGGILMGTSSVTTAKTQFHDLLLTLETFSDLEMKFSARAKKGDCVHLLFHITQSGKQATASPLKFMLTGEWIDTVLRLQGGTLKVTKGSTEKTFDSFSPGRDGVLGLALDPGAIVEIKDLKIRRLK